ncbi:MAG: cob(I)yrinic acid a,c-diamide adenosyltransferase [Candidatus Kerfeldbacteria bacterium]|nr:cob(I)yrinic acid a,c-diamide adenosyltransferase [Candidatus Kerfeldbacteria bacterium]
MRNSKKKFVRKEFRRPARPVTPRGLVLYYYGDGKGKTTAAVGLATRAAGAGLRVVFLQFMKTLKWPSFERPALEKLGVDVLVLGSGFVGIIDDRSTLRTHRTQARKALATTLRLVRSGRYGVVAADEIVSAVEEGLLTVRDVLALIRAKPAMVHLVVTGHSRYAAIVQASDVVTEMQNVKHPYKTEGMLAQKGIDW